MPKRKIKKDLEANTKENHYNHIKIEEKWCKIWEKNDLFQNDIAKAGEVDKKDIVYLLFAFAYPSGSGLHVGHVESKTALDIVARYHRMNGKTVFFPVGWDAFGLPAENYAIKTGVPPVKTTKDAIDTFRRQIKRLGISYDWANEIATCHPGYYEWTQWLFLQLYKHKFAFQKKGKVNWCPSCKTVLANEQVINGCCERCDTQVEQKDLKQWYFKITAYRDELLSGLKEVDWPNATKQQQINWIGKKEGINIEYKIDDSKEKISCFTTRPDTNFGATFLVLAPEHPFVQKIIEKNIKATKGKDNSAEVKKYYQKAMKKTELERQTEGRNKTGVFTGFYAINDLNGKKMPIWVSDFVLAGFGTGAVVGVPGHDKRDFEFAQKFNLEVIRVVKGEDKDISPITKIEQVQEEQGTMVNSEFLNGLDIHKATVKIMDHMEEKGMGKRVTTYKLRDWLISRQRYWGAPIPVVYDPQGKPYPVKEEHLPWLLPTDVDFKPTGESPLKSSKEFIARTERLYGKGWRPEFDTMDTFVDSSWYYLRYLGSRNEESYTSLDKVKQYMPSDLYLIGPEHIVLHLLYSRFFTKFLRDHDLLDLKSGEPFYKMRHQGMILGPDGKKMSKSKGNVISPDTIIKKYGADTLRIYEMFMGPLEADKPWDDGAVMGVKRFLNRVFSLSTTAINGLEKGLKLKISRKVQEKLHQTIRKVTADIPKLKFNTSIAAMMEFSHTWLAAQGLSPDSRVITRQDLVSFLQLLHPFAPFLTEELWHRIEEKADSDTLSLLAWPKFDKKLAAIENREIVVQVNGKVRAKFNIKSKDVENEESIKKQATELEAVQKWVGDKKIKRVLYIKGRVVSIVF